MTYPILQSGYAFEPVNSTIITVEPSAGMAYAQRTTLDEPFLFSVTWQTTDRDAFESWAQSVAETGYSETLQIEAGEPVVVDVVFTERGYPQLQSVQDGTYTYSGELFANVVNNPDDGLYDHLLFAAENSSDKDPETWFNALDLVINDILPEDRSPEYYFRIGLDLTINKILPEA